MNKGFLILNGILVVAIGVLFYLHFSAKKQPQFNNSKVNGVLEDENTPSLVMTDSLNKFISLDSNIMAKPIKIGYIHSDSVDKNLKILADIKAELELKQKELENKVKNQKAGYEAQFKKKVDDFEKKRQNYAIKGPSMTDAQLKSEGQVLEKMQQEIMGAEQQYQAEMMNFQGKLEQEYFDLQAAKMDVYYQKVQGFAKNIAAQLGFDFILIYREGDQILYANKAYDISKYVISAVNKEYEAGKSKK